MSGVERWLRVGRQNFGVAGTRPPLASSQPITLLSRADEVIE